MKISTARLRMGDIFITVLCGLYRLFAGKADKKIAPKKILVVQLAKLGDMISVTPMLRAIKINYPGSVLYVMGDEVNRELLQNNPDTDRYLVFRRRKFWTMVRTLRREKIDAAFLTGPGTRAVAMLYLAGIPFIAAPVIRGGFTPLETRSYRLLSKFVVTRAYTIGHYAPREYLRLLEALGIKADDTSKRLAFSPAAREEIARFFSENGIRPETDLVVGIFPSTGYAVKQWPPERFAKIADWLFAKFKAKIIIPGSEGDRKAVEDMIAALDPVTGVINACGKFNLDELKALISRMSLFISVDTGPLYIAEAFGVPTVDIVGPVDHLDQPPIGPLSKVVYLPSRQKPALGVWNARVFDENEVLRQRDGITVEMVIEKLEEIINSDAYQTKFRRRET